MAPRALLAAAVLAAGAACAQGWQRSTPCAPKGSCSHESCSGGRAKSYRLKGSNVCHCECPPGCFEWGVGEAGGNDVKCIGVSCDGVQWYPPRTDCAPPIYRRDDADSLRAAAQERLATLSGASEDRVRCLLRTETSERLLVVCTVVEPPAGAPSSPTAAECRVRLRAAASAGLVLEFGEYSFGFAVADSTIVASQPGDSTAGDDDNAVAVYAGAAAGATFLIVLAAVLGLPRRRPGGALGSQAVVRNAAFDPQELDAKIDALITRADRLLQSSGRPAAYSTSN